MNAPSIWLRFLFAALFLLVASASPARAAGETAPAPARAAVEVEPNDTTEDTARQPALVDGNRFTGTLSAQDDYDSFRLMVGAGRPGRVELTVTNTSPAATGAVISAAIGDRTGEQDLATAGDDGLAPGQSATVSATLAAGGAYRFTIQFPCESDVASDCPTSVPGATWSLAVKVRTGVLLLDAGGVLGAAADAAAETALDALLDAPEDDDTAAARAPSMVGAIPAACTAQGRAVQQSTRKVTNARRANRKRHSRASRRKLRTARIALMRANANLTDCKAVASSAAKAAEAALSSDEPTE